LHLRHLKLGLLIFGFLALATIVVHIGPSRISSTVASLGAVVVAVTVLPSVVMYILDNYGWRFTLGKHRTVVSFLRLFMIRAAGEFLNATTPTGGVGGEPLKATLLKNYSIPTGEGLASVVVAKTTMTIAQIIYIVLGMGLGVWLLLPVTPTATDVNWGMTVGFSVALLVFVTALFLVMQWQGLFSSLFKILAVCRIHIAFLEARRKDLLSVDASVVGFYRRDKVPFILSTTSFLCGWFMEAVEVYVMLRCLGEPIDPFTAISIDALSTVIKGGASFIPGSVGVQEGGIVLLLRAHGYGDVTGITLALLRRLRELIWIAIGVVCLAIQIRTHRGHPSSPLDVA
jgi:uncharacterized protein (TIRG00374 family)